MLKLKPSPSIQYLIFDQTLLKVVQKLDSTLQLSSGQQGLDNLLFYRKLKTFVKESIFSQTLFKSIDL